MASASIAQQGVCLPRLTVTCTIYQNLSLLACQGFDGLASQVHGEACLMMECLLGAETLARSLASVGGPL